MNILVEGIQTPIARSLQNGECDAYGQKPQVHIAKGSSNPCRHCLQLIDEGQNKLLVSFRPFAKLQPYAETGPIFLHQNQCERYVSHQFPDWFVHLEPALVQGYDDQDWIIYEVSDAVAGNCIEDKCREILNRQEVAYIHIRSKYNCFQCRVSRAS